MRKLLIAAGAAAVLLLALLLLASSLAAQLTPPRFDPVEYERQQIAIERARALAPVETAAAVVATVLPVAAAVVALVLLAAWGSVALIRFRVERQPDSRGLLPVLGADQHTARAALAGYHAARLEEARRPLTPHTLTYSPAFHNRSDGSGIPLLPDHEPAALGQVPTFAQLLDGGRVGRGQPLLLGVDAETGAELPGAWLDLYATATAGLPGTGKTTSQRFFAAQTALHGARFVVCDPHASAGAESLAGTLAPLRAAFLCEPAEEPAAILDAVRYVADIGEARKKGRDTSTTPIILWVDELTGLLGRSDVGDELAGLLELIAQEYRKKFVYLSASGQIWTAARVTSELRDSLASVLCHRMKRSQARMLLPTEEAAQVERLATGEAILWRTSGVTTRVRIPNTTGADMARVAELLAGGAPAARPSGAASEGRPIGFRPARPEGATEGATEGADVAPLPRRQNAANLTPEEARILAAFIGGKTASELAEQLAGTAGGRKYADASRRVADILRRALGAQGVEHA